MVHSGQGAALDGQDYNQFMRRYIAISIVLQLGLLGVCEFWRFVMHNIAPSSWQVQAQPVRIRHVPIELDLLELDIQLPAEDNAELVKPAVKTGPGSGQTRSATIESLIADRLLDIPYPPLARKMGMQGTVLIRIQINTEGQLEQLQLVQSSGFDPLDRAALHGIRSWNFGPGPAASVVVPVVFRLL
ncbi:MAG: energy transducer TonB [Leptospiraceae bacterium]|nr:energy transducer TonB [Leptospiraceae bacterium]